MPFTHKPLLGKRWAGRAAREGSAASLCDAWRAWVAENLALGVTPADLVARLRDHGVPERVAALEIETIGRSPLTAGVQRVARDLERHELVARLQREVGRLASSPTSVERRGQLGASEFFDRYYAANRPVVITDALAPFPALARWSPGHFKERFGGVEVEVMAGRDADPACDANFEAFCAKTHLGAFCDRVTSTGPTNDFYLVANNRATNRPALKELLDDVSGPHEYLDDRRDSGWTSLWFGPAGTVTPLHHDTANVLFGQVYGRKRFLLVPPSETLMTHAMHHGVYSAIDPEHPDLEAFPDFARVSVRQVDLAPGDALFLPVGWWHQVRAMDISISLAFTAFKVANQFDWYYPGKIR
jgi:hypothetical protein